MTARQVIHVKEIRDDGSIVEIIIWRLDMPVPPCEHCYKYRLYYGSQGSCRIRYDNERGKGDHLHLDGVEKPYRFVSIAELLADFRREVEAREVP